MPQQFVTSLFVPSFTALSVRDGEYYSNCGVAVVLVVIIITAVVVIVVVLLVVELQLDSYSPYPSPSS